MHRPCLIMCVTVGNQIYKVDGMRGDDILAETFDNLEVKGAAQEASPNLILGTSSSSSISASLSVIDAKSN